MISVFNIRISAGGKCRRPGKGPFLNRMKKILLICGTVALSAGILSAAYVLSAPSHAAGAEAARETEQPASTAPAGLSSAAEGLEEIYLEAEAEDALPSPIYRFENYIFLGDSLIYGPKEVITAHGHQVLAGVGATIQNLSQISTANRTLGVQGMACMTGTLRGRAFNGIVILMGANDVVGDFGTAERAMEKYQSVLEELRAACEAPVFVLKVFPTGPSYCYWDRTAVGERTEALNAMLEAYCAETEGVYFIDATAGFTDENGNLIHDLGDGLHIGPNYYEDFYGGIETALYDTGLFYTQEGL